VKYAFAEIAERRADVVDRWWRKHRPKAADLFREELDEAVLQILDAPLVPPVHRVVRGVEYRRLLMPKTKQYVYYSVDLDEDLVVIATVWGAKRGREPRLSG
jgi:plasmid stabilization system protein ParE